MSLKNKNFFTYSVLCSLFKNIMISNVLAVHGMSAGSWMILCPQYHFENTSLLIIQAVQTT
jgi:hypothetical protein